MQRLPPSSIKGGSDLPSTTSLTTAESSYSSSCDNLGVIFSNVGQQNNSFKPFSSVQRDGVKSMSQAHLNSNTGQLNVACEDSQRIQSEGSTVVGCRAVSARVSNSLLEDSVCESSSDQQGFDQFFEDAPDLVPVEPEPDMYRPRSELPETPESFGCKRRKLQARISHCAPIGRPPD